MGSGCDRDRPDDAADGWLRIPAHAAGAGAGDSGDCADGFWEPRKSALSDPRPGSVLVFREAGETGRFAAAAAARHRSQPAAARGGEPQTRLSAANIVRAPGRTLRRDAGCVFADPAGGAAIGVDSSDRRKRDGEGTGGSRDSQLESAGKPTVCGGELRGATGDADRE